MNASVHKCPASLPASSHSPLPALNTKPADASEPSSVVPDAEATQFLESDDFPSSTSVAALRAHFHLLVTMERWLKDNRRQYDPEYVDDEPDEPPEPPQKAAKSPTLPHPILRLPTSPTAQSPRTPLHPALHTPATSIRSPFPSSPLRDTSPPPAFPLSPTSPTLQTPVASPIRKRGRSKGLVRVRIDPVTSELVELFHDLPGCLRVACPACVSVSGWYRLHPFRQKNDMPVWHEGEKKWLYLGDKGHWVLTDDEGDLEACRGYVQSTDKCTDEKKLPHEHATWQSYHKGRWVDNPSIRVFIPTDPPPEAEGAGGGVAVLRVPPVPSVPSGHRTASPPPSAPTSAFFPIETRDGGELTLEGCLESERRRCISACKSELQEFLSDALPRKIRDEMCDVRSSTRKAVASAASAVEEAHRERQQAEGAADNARKAEQVVRNELERTASDAAAVQDRLVEAKSRLHNTLVGLRACHDQFARCIAASKNNLASYLTAQDTLVRRLAFAEATSTVAERAARTASWMDSEQTLERLKAMNRSLEAQVGEMEACHEQQEMELEEKTTLIEDLQHELSQTLSSRRELEERLDNLVTEYTAVQAALSSSEALCEERAKEIEALERANEEYEFTVQELNEKLLKTMEDFDSISAELTASQLASADIERGVVRLETANKLHQEEIDRLEAELRQTSTELSTTTSKLRAAQATLEQKSQSLAKLEKAHSASLQEVERLEARLRHSNSELKSLSEDLNASQRLCDTRNAGLSRLERQHAESRSEVERLESELRQVGNELHAANRELEATKEKLTASRASEAGLQEQVKCLSADLKGVRKQLTETTSQLTAEASSYTSELQRVQALHAHTVKELTDTHSTELQRLMEQHEEAVRKMEASHKLEKEALRSRHEGLVADMEEAHTQKLRAREASHEKERAELESAHLEALKAAEARGEAAKKAGKMEVQYLQDRYTSEQQQLEEGHRQMVKELQARHQAEIERLQAECQQRIADMERAHQLDMEVAQANITSMGEEASTQDSIHAIEIQQLRAQHNTQIANLTAEHKRALSEQEARCSALEKELKEKEAEANQRLRDMETSHAAEDQARRAELREVQGLLEDSKVARDELEAELREKATEFNRLERKAKDEVAQLQEQLKHARDEVEIITRTANNVEAEGVQQVHKLAQQLHEAKDALTCSTQREKELQQRIEELEKKILDSQGQIAAMNLEIKSMRNKPTLVSVACGKDELTREDWKAVRNALIQRHGSMRAAFSNMNTNARQGGKALDVKELQIGMQLVGVGHLAEKLLSALDYDNSGDITQKEFLNLLDRDDPVSPLRRANEEAHAVISKLPPAQRELYFKQIFQSMDRNGDGMLSRAELIRALRNNQTAQALLWVPGASKLPAVSWAEQLLQKLPADGGGNILWYEFLNYMKDSLGIDEDEEPELLATYPSTRRASPEKENDSSSTGRRRSSTLEDRDLALMLRSADAKVADLRKQLADKDEEIEQLQSQLQQFEDAASGASVDGLSPKELEVRLRKAEAALAVAEQKLRIVEDREMADEVESPLRFLGSLETSQRSVRSHGESPHKLPVDLKPGTVGIELDKSCYVKKVVPESPAAAAGMQIGDRVTWLATRPELQSSRISIYSPKVFGQALNGLLSGSLIEIGFTRNGKKDSRKMKTAETSPEKALKSTRADFFTPPLLSLNPSGESVSLSSSMNSNRGSAASPVKVPPRKAITSPTTSTASSSSRPPGVRSPISPLLSKRK